MNEQTSRGIIWAKAWGTGDAMELLKLNHHAYVLAAVIALRARWTDEFNQHNLAKGEAFLGDHREYSMSEQEYRTAKKHLEKWKFATFKATNKGTIGKLIDHRLFTPPDFDGNEQNNRQVTGGQRTANGRLTTNEDRIDRKNVKDQTSNTARIGLTKVGEMLEQVGTVLGSKELSLNHKRWRERAEKYPDKLFRVIADTRNKMREQGLQNPAAWAETMWKNFG